MNTVKSYVTIWTMKNESLIHLRVPAATKGRWIRASRAAEMRLTDWIVNAVESTGGTCITENQTSNAIEKPATVKTLGEKQMLVLTRAVGETVVMKTPAGEIIEIVVVEKKGNQVKLGINAPSSINIARSELLESGANAVPTG